MTDSFVIKETEDRLTSDFPGYGYVQYAGSECRKDRCTRYHSYVIPKNCDLSDAISFCVRKQHRFGLDKRCGFLKKRQNQQKKDSGRARTIEDGSSSGWDGQDRKLELSAFPFETEIALQSYEGMNYSINKAK